jgi:hypothetical protein
MGVLAGATIPAPGLAAAVALVPSATLLLLPGAVRAARYLEPGSGIPSAAPPDDASRGRRAHEGTGSHGRSERIFGVFGSAALQSLRVVAFLASLAPPLVTPVVAIAVAEGAALEPDALLLSAIRTVPLVLAATLALRFRLRRTLR